LKELWYNDDMNELSPLEIYHMLETLKLREFVELVSNGKRPDGTYNYCREALEKKAQQLLEELKQIKQDGLRNLC
jgi:hypothetical protein